jgi:hypothetical protein
MRSKGPKYGDMRWSIQIMRRVITGPLPFQAEIDHGYTPVITTRAACDTTKGVQEFNRVSVDRQATHVFTIRYTTIPFDIRDRVQDSLGNQYVIMAVDDVQQNRTWLKITTARAGSNTRQSVT